MLSPLPFPPTPRYLSPNSRLVEPGANSETETFEGLALGSRIAEIDWSSHPQRPWLMCLAYGLT